MKPPLNRKTLAFYLWVSLFYFSLWVLANATKFPGMFFPVVLNNLWRTCYVMVLNFLLFEYSVPFIQKKRRYLLFNILYGVVIGWFYIMLYSYGHYAWRQLGVALRVYTPLVDYSTVSHAVEAQFAFSVGSVFVYGIARHLYYYLRLKQSAQQLRIEKQEAELNYLRSQTNPHFLFNTLNNIYSLARDKSDLAPESILRLSKILRYMLYEAAGQYIAIEQELKIIADYISLEKLRYDDSLRVNFNYDVEDMKQALPPLLLVPLVENAFKHGVSETRSRPFVDIHLSVRQRHLTLTVINSSEGTEEEGAITEHIGLSNLRRQLELLYADYQLHVQQMAGQFSARLKINLASHV